MSVQNQTSFQAKLMEEQRVTTAPECPPSWSTSARYLLEGTLFFCNLVSSYKPTQGLEPESGSGTSIYAFYSRNCCRIVLSQSVCPWSAFLSLLQWSFLQRDSALMIGSQPCLQFQTGRKGLPGTNTLAFYDTATFTFVKGFVVQTPGRLRVT